MVPKTAELTLDNIAETIHPSKIIRYMTLEQCLDVLYRRKLWFPTVAALQREDLWEGYSSKVPYVPDVANPLDEVLTDLDTISRTLRETAPRNMFVTCWYKGVD